MMGTKPDRERKGNRVRGRVPLKRVVASVINLTIGQVFMRA
jgi:hypothetical protein